jgi:hypothetical protein
MNSRQTHNAVQGIAPPSGKLYIPEYVPDERPLRISSPRAVKESNESEDPDEESKDEVAYQVTSIYSDQAIY